MIEFTKNELESMLTDKQCDGFRRLPLNFNDMVRMIYITGYKSCLKEILDGTGDNIKQNENK